MPLLGRYVSNYHLGRSVLTSLSKTQPTQRASDTPSVTTRSATRKSKADAFFLTTKMLERVLRFLPMKDLLLSQRVCRKWRDVIVENDGLQQQLFLRPSPVTETWEFEYGSPPGDIVKLTKLAKPVMTARPSQTEYAVPSKLNTARLSNNKSRGNDIDHGTTVDLAAGEIFEFRDAARWRHESGSWRDMFAMQPPPTEIYAEYMCGEFLKSRGGYECHIVGFFEPTGLTLGKLVDVGLELDAQGKNVRWDRCWFQAYGRVCFTEEERAKTTLP